MESRTMPEACELRNNRLFTARDPVNSISFNSGTFKGRRSRIRCEALAPLSTSGASMGNLAAVRSGRELVFTVEGTCAGRGACVFGGSFRGAAVVAVPRDAGHGVVLLLQSLFFGASLEALSESRFTYGSPFRSLFFGALLEAFSESRLTYIDPLRSSGGDGMALVGPPPRCLTSLSTSLWPYRYLPCANWPELVGRAVLQPRGVFMAPLRELD